MTNNPFDIHSFLFRSKQKGTAVFQNITPAELHSRLINSEMDPILLDVRTPFEYFRDGHLAGTVIIPLNELLQMEPEIPKEKTIVLICRAGHRSQIACEYLALQGHSKLYNLDGGMLAWHWEGLPYE